MENKITKLPRAATMQTWDAVSARQFVADLARKTGLNDKESLYKKWRKELEKAGNHGVYEAVLEYAFTNMYLAATRTGIFSGAPVGYSKENYKERVEKLVSGLKKATLKLTPEIYVEQLGKKLKDCTCGEIKSLGGLFIEIGAWGKESQKLGDIPGLERKLQSIVKEHEGVV